MTPTKRIAIYCDGTWNRADAEHPTNVVKLAQATRHRDADGKAQIVHYVQGVGSGRGTGGLARKVDEWGGGAFGWGLTNNLEEAYRSLVFSYEPGDRVFVFGFSRGAYMARSLAGLIRSTGILHRDRIGALPEAIERYRSRGKDTHPDTEASHRFRLDNSPDVHTSSREAAWRREVGKPEGERFKLAYLGVWDTVGALGVPKTFGTLASLFNDKYAFHDTALSSSVEAARHAVAIDERRTTFPPSPWKNLVRLNEAAAAAGDAAMPYRQEWFPGGHGSVGGGGDVTGLSDAALLWIAEGAASAGLAFDEEAIKRIRASADHRAALSNRSQPDDGVFAKFLKLRQRDREGPTDMSAVHQSARRRYFEDGDALPERQDYRPGSLRELRQAFADLGRPDEGNRA